MYSGGFLRVALARWTALARAGEPTPDAAAVRSLHRAMRRSLFEDPIELADLQVTGNDLRRAGIAAGPIYAKILHALLERVLEDPARNTPDALLAEVPAIWRRSTARRDPGFNQRVSSRHVCSFVASSPRPPSGVGFERLRDGFTFTEADGVYAAHIVANAERVVDLMWTMTELLAPPWTSTSTTCAAGESGRARRCRCPTFATRSPGSSCCSPGSAAWS